MLTSAERVDGEEPASGAALGSKGSLTSHDVEVHISSIAKRNNRANRDWRAAMCPRGHSWVFDKEGRGPFEKSRQPLWGLACVQACSWQ
jgi:hypothetical protein